MIKEGNFVLNGMNLWGYVGAATEEEAERLSNGDNVGGIIIYIPTTDAVTQAEIDIIAGDEKDAYK